jgi:hypothetical protein
MKRPGTRRLILGLAVAWLASAAYVLVRVPPGPRSVTAFDPDRVAAIEVDMWQAYYRKENLRLFRGLLQVLREQYQYSWAQGAVTGFYLARAAATFGNLRSDYAQVLPDLERAYTRIRDWLGASFDPAAVARAELAWWVARRDPATLDPQNVGRLIADVNAQIFNRPAAAVLEASILRARAGRLRDEGGEHADWATVSALLHQSHRDLHRAVSQ